MIKKLRFKGISSFIYLSILISGVMELRAQNVSPTFYTSGNMIMDPCGTRFIPRGINYSVLDDYEFPGNMNTGGELSAQIVQANPNLVRIAWWNEYPFQPPVYDLSHLDSLIRRFKREGVVTMIALMDVTCNDDYSLFNSRIPAFWTNPAVVALINQHQGNVIINIANEFGFVNWSGDPSTAITNWKNLYSQTISSIRASGIKVPLVIDAPECGTSLDRLLEVGQQLVNEDPESNIILSAHAYWPTTLGNDSLTLRGKLTQMNQAGYPIILGEIANWQTENNDNPCTNPINYKALLRMCEEFSTPWMSWAWTDDHCSERRISADGNLTSLTDYGNTILYNPQFGLLSHALKTPYMTNRFSCITGIKAIGNTKTSLRIVTFPEGIQALKILENGFVTISTVQGRIIKKMEVREGMTIELNDLNYKGLMLISHRSVLGKQEVQKTVLN